MGGCETVTYIKAFTIRFVLDELESRKYQIEVMNIATVDVQGVICITIMTITLEGFIVSVQFARME